MGFEVLLLPVLAALYLWAVIKCIGAALVDVRSWWRGKPSQRLADAQARAKTRGSRSRRREARDYFGDVWADTWLGMRRRRRERMTARERAEVPASRGGRVASWWGRTRERVSVWWDDRTQRVDDVREARRIADDQAVNGRPPMWQRLRDTAVVDPGAEEAERRQAAAVRDGQDKTSGRDTPPEPDDAKPQDAPDGGASNVIPIRRDRHTDSDRQDRSATDPTGSDKPTEPQQRPNPLEEPTMAEATGLGPDISYAAAQRDAHQQAVANNEMFAASLTAQEVGGDAVTAVHQAMELESQTAQAWGRVHDTLVSHMAVAEAYAGTGNQAGSKQYVTSG